MNISPATTAAAEIASLLNNDEFSGLFDINVKALSTIAGGQANMTSLSVDEVSKATNASSAFNAWSTTNPIGSFVCQVAKAETEGYLPSTKARQIINGQTDQQNKVLADFVAENMNDISGVFSIGRRVLASAALVLLSVGSLTYTPEANASFGRINQNTNSSNQYNNNANQNRYSQIIQQTTTRKRGNKYQLAGRVVHVEQAPLKCTDARDNLTSSPILGAIGGGLSGSAVGKGDGKKVAIGVGAVLGAVVASNNKRENKFKTSCRDDGYNVVVEYVSPSTGAANHMVRHLPRGRVPRVGQQMTITVR